MPTLLFICRQSHQLSVSWIAVIALLLLPLRCYVIQLTILLCIMFLQVAIVRTKTVHCHTMLEPSIFLVLWRQCKITSIKMAAQCCSIHAIAVPLFKELTLHFAFCTSSIPRCMDSPMQQYRSTPLFILSSNSYCSFVS